MRLTRQALLLAGGLLLLVAAPAIADMAAGRRAYEAGMFARALDLLLPAAEKGDAEAQFLLGAIYSEGAREVKAEPARAVAWYRKAAEQGNPSAQYELFVLAGDRAGAAAGRRDEWARRLAEQGRRLAGHARSQAAFCAEYLGLLHGRGQLLPRDTVAGYAWLALALQLGRQEAQAAHDMLAADMSPAELAAARVLAATLGR
ncbi:MAG: sel1 repeat family protein [Alphaproteobacteria bacterium]|nr:sel1 repeat family protein [Alphaproteobacteria bacterium]